MNYRHVYVIMHGQRIGDNWIKSLMFTDAFVHRHRAEILREEAIEGNEDFNHVNVTVESLCLSDF